MILCRFVTDFIDVFFERQEGHDEGSAAVGERSQGEME